MQRLRLDKLYDNRNYFIYIVCGVHTLIFVTYFCNNMNIIQTFLYYTNVYVLISHYVGIHLQLDKKKSSLIPIFIYLIFFIILLLFSYPHYFHVDRMQYLSIIIRDYCKNLFRDTNNL